MRALPWGGRYQCHRRSADVAGQRPSYLYTKVKAYQTGARDDHTMEGAVKFLNDDALVKVAAYYASLEPAPPAAADASSKAAPPLDPVAAGKAAAGACAGCHGETGVTATAGTPNLIGLRRKVFCRGDERLQERAAPERHDEDGCNVVERHRRQALGAVLRAAKAFARENAGQRERSGRQGGERSLRRLPWRPGVSSNPANPSLAGQDAEYFASAMRAYKNGKRSEETMKLAAAGLGDAAIADLAAYFAAQQPQQPKVTKPLTLAEWVQRCDRCHGINGNSTDPRTPAIAAQRIEYLQKSLKAYQGNQRRNSVMAAMSASLTDADVASLAAFYARQKARPFVFVMIPGN